MATMITTQPATTDPKAKDDHTDRSESSLPPTDPLSTLESLMKARHSTRVFLPNKPVPEDLLIRCLRIAQQSPSNSNMQPWRLKLASGPARDRIVAAISHEAHIHGPKVPPLPEEYNHFRSAMGANLYGPDGYDCPREDNARHKELQMRNFCFFDAPVVGVMYMDAQLTHMDAMTVGFFVQTFTLALTAVGLGACWQVSVTGFPEVLGRVFGLGVDGGGVGKGKHRILCGVAIGWPADEPVNRVEMGREPLDSCVYFMKD